MVPIYSTRTFWGGIGLIVLGLALLWANARSLGIREGMYDQESTRRNQLSCWLGIATGLALIYLGVTSTIRFLHDWSAG